MLHMTTAWKDKEAQPWYSWKVLTQKSKTNFSQKLKNYPQDMSYVTQVSSSWIEWRLFLLKMTNDLSQSQNLSGYQNRMETFYTLVKKKIKGTFWKHIRFQFNFHQFQWWRTKKNPQISSSPCEAGAELRGKEEEMRQRKGINGSLQNLFVWWKWKQTYRGLNSNIPQKLQLKNWCERLVHFAEMSLQ